MEDLYLGEAMLERGRREDLILHCSKSPCWRGADQFSWSKRDHASGGHVRGQGWVQTEGLREPDRVVLVRGVR